jgi:hypothetical protein
VKDAAAAAADDDDDADCNEISYYIKGGKNYVTKYLCFYKFSFVDVAYRTQRHYITNEHKGEGNSCYREYSLYRVLQY